MTRSSQRKAKRINRNIVECKDKKINNSAQRVCVLIETSWNVKEETEEDEDVQNFVLIETSWNVKLQIREVQRNPLRINRNIVECKD